MEVVEGVTEFCYVDELVGGVSNVAAPGGGGPSGCGVIRVPRSLYNNNSSTSNYCLLNGHPQGHKKWLFYKRGDLLSTG